MIAQERSGFFGYHQTQMLRDWLRRFVPPDKPIKHKTILLEEWAKAVLPASYEVYRFVTKLASPTAIPTATARLKRN